MSNLLDSASIVLTPTAYDNGKMLSVKPSAALSAELVTNGDFATDSDWNKQSGWTISGGTANVNSSSAGSTYMRQNATITGRVYKITFEVTSFTSGALYATAGSAAGSLAVTGVGVYTDFVTANNTGGYGVYASGSNTIASIDNISIKEDISGDFDFSRNSAATRVNAQGLVENVQILSGDLVSNGDFSQVGTEEVSNGSFSQEGAEEVTNGDFATDSDWFKSSFWTISGGTASMPSTSSYLPLYQNDVTIAGKTYVLNFDIVSITGIIKATSINNGAASGEITLGEYSTIGNKKITFTTQSGRESIAFARVVGNTSSCTIDNVSVKEVGQDWNLGTGWSIGEDKASRTAQSGSTSMYQSVSFTANKSYKITYDLDISAGSFLLRIGGGALINTSARTTSGTYTEYIVANSGNNVLNLRAVDGNFIGSITNISVKEVGQDWDLQDGWSIGDNKSTFNLSSGAGNISQSNVFESGKTYILTFDTLETNGGNMAYRFGLAGFVFINAIAANTKHSIIFTVTSPGSLTLRGADNFVGSITNISVIEITDDTNLPRINYEGFSYQDSLGSEEVPDGNFTNQAAVDYWAIASNRATKSLESGFMRLTYTSSIGAALFRNNLAVSGKNYVVTFRAKGTANVTFSSIGENNSIGDNPTNPIITTEWQDYKFNVPLLGITFRFYLENGLQVGDTLDIANISVKEYLGQEVVPDSGCGSWLLEPQSTNLITYSEDFSQSVCNKGGVNISSIGISPSGSISTLLTEDTSNGEHRIYHNNISVSIGVVYTDSFYIKSNGRSKIRLSYTGFNNYEPKFDFVNNNLISSTGGTTANIKSVSFGNGWYKVSVTDTATLTGLRGVISLMKDDLSFQYVGDGTSGVYIWGAMLEQQSYSTSYIPTNGAASTRLQDIANNSGNATLINSTEGVLYAEIAALADDGTYRIFSLNDGTRNERVYIQYKPASNEISGVVKNGNNTQANINYFLSDETQYAKIAFKWKENDFAFWVNGVERGTDTSGSVPVGLSKLSFDQSNDSNYFYGKTKALVVYKEALTDEQLTCLTTI